MVAHYFLCGAVGVHTLHYKVFVEVGNNSFDLLSFPIPEFRGEPETLVGMSSSPNWNPSIILKLVF